MLLSEKLRALQAIMASGRGRDRNPIQVEGISYVDAIRGPHVRLTLDDLEVIRQEVLELEKMVGIVKRVNERAAFRSLELVNWWEFVEGV